MKAHYRSNHPEVIAAWAETQRKYQEVHDAIGALAERYDRKALVYRGSDYRLAGLDGEKPEGPWRQDKKGAWVPHRGMKGGRALAKEFDACRASGLGRVPGMPANADVRGTGLFNMTSPAMFDADGYVYAGWNAEPEEVANSGWGPKLDLSMWEEIKASQYHLARESKGLVDAE